MAPYSQDYLQELRVWEIDQTKNLLQGTEHPNEVKNFFFKDAKTTIKWCLLNPVVH